MLLINVQNAHGIEFAICKLGQMKAREEMKFFKEAGLSTNYPSDLP